MKGIYAASMSILKDNLSLNVNATIQHAENVIEKGAHGVVMFGSTGQAQLISIYEKKTLLERLSTSKFKKNFIIGTGCNSLIETINLMKYCLKQGHDKFLLMPPAYYKYGDGGAYSFYSKVIDQLPDAKIILYNFEKLCGYKFSIKIVEKMAKDFSNQIIGVKDSSYNLFENLKIDNFYVFPGSETKLLKGLSIGCSGIISAITNVTASLARSVFDDFHKNKKCKNNEKLCSVRKVFDKYNLISALHSFKSMENKSYKNILPPLILLKPEEQKILMLELEKLNFLPEKNKAA